MRDIRKNINTVRTLMCLLLGFLYAACSEDVGSQPSRPPSGIYAHCATPILGTGARISQFLELSPASYNVLRRNELTEWPTAFTELITNGKGDLLARSYGGSLVVIDRDKLDVKAFYGGPGSWQDAKKVGEVSVMGAGILALEGHEWALLTIRNGGSIEYVRPVHFPTDGRAIWNAPNSAWLFTDSAASTDVLLYSVSESPEIVGSVSYPRDVFAGSSSIRPIAYSDSTMIVAVADVVGRTSGGADKYGTTSFLLLVNRDTLELNGMIEVRGCWRPDSLVVYEDIAWVGCHTSNDNSILSTDNSSFIVDLRSNAVASLVVNHGYGLLGVRLLNDGNVVLLNGEPGMYVVNGEDAEYVKICDDGLVLYDICYIP